MPTAAARPNSAPASSSAALPDQVSGVEGKEIVFQSAVISSGHSGGALLDANGNIIGMTIADQPPFGRAIDIYAVMAQLQEWGYPVRLNPFLANGWTQLHVGARQGNLPLLTTLLSECGGVNTPHEHKATPLHYAAAYSDGPQVFSLLLRAGANLEAKDTDGDTPLSWAALSCTSSHANVNAADGLGEAPLDRIVSKKGGPEYLEAVKLLAAAGGKIRTRSLEYLAQTGTTSQQLDLFQTLLPAAHDRTPLFVAFEQNAREIADFLLAHGASVRAPGTPELHLEERLKRAVEAGWATAVKVLLDAGTNPHIPEFLNYSNTDTPLQYLRRHPKPEIEKLLLDAGAKQ